MNESSTGEKGQVGRGGEVRPKACMKVSLQRKGDGGEEMGTREGAEALGDKVLPQGALLRGEPRAVAPGG